jgi:hypothetical protein
MMSMRTMQETRMTTMHLERTAPDVAVTRHPTRPGVSLTMGPVTGSRISPVWTMGGWRLQFVRLAPGERLEMDGAGGTVYVKVITGALADPPRKAYPAVGELVSTRLNRGSVTASDEGALIAVFTETSEVPKVLSRIDQLRIDGPLAECFGWQTFAERFGKVTAFFNGADAHLVPGFHLLDNNGAEIAYVYFWAAGRGVDLSTHNHGHTPSEQAPAFAEVHQVLHNGTGHGGMYQTPAPGAAERTRLPMQRGEEHGPFFLIDEATGRPRLRDNGAVDYPWHGWQAGQDGMTDRHPVTDRHQMTGQRYDLVCAYEITAPYAKVR